jgi:CheY-like chemotaxis protein/anti-sigma regulatory factor (Ser/Thr protein kinase)
MSPAEPSQSRILIVDDNAVDRRIAGALVETMLGWHVAYAADGQQALAALAALAPDVVLTDLQMPNLDGLQLVDALVQRYPLVPVVLMTAYGSESIARKALQSGAASYVPKISLAQSLAPTLEQVVAAAKRRYHHQQLDERLTLAELHFTLENDPSLLPVLIARLQEHLAAMRLAGRDGDIRVGIALEEALLNALYHGNLEVSSELRQNGDAAFYALAWQRRCQSPYQERRIYLIARINARDAIFSIRDDGPGFDVGKLPDPTDVENLGKPSGRGVMLMRAFMDEVTYNEQGNQVTLVKRKAGP